MTTTSIILHFDGSFTFFCVDIGMLNEFGSENNRKTAARGRSSVITDSIVFKFGPTMKSFFGNSHQLERNFKLEIICIISYFHFFSRVHRFVGGTWKCNGNP